MLDTQTDLLIEIGTEELPPVALPKLALALQEGFRSRLEASGVSYEQIERYGTPRRLALLVRGMASRQPDQETVRRGPALQAAFDDAGKPTKAALGFAGSCGVGVAELEREETEKGVWLVYRRTSPGQMTARLVPAMTESALSELPIPKRMRWGEGNEEFVRPVHWVCMRMGAMEVAGEVLGLPIVSWTRGHRFHHPEAIEIREASDYASVLRETGKVEADFVSRRELVRRQVETLAESHGLRARIDEALLDEVTSLVEWPQALLCGFDERFLDIPPEVLIETMQSNQKYFPLEDAEGRLQAHFIAVANIESREPEKVRAGNERVIRPRFEDAAFFWSQDLKQPLASFQERLEAVVFQDKLGSLADKSRRVSRLAKTLAGPLGTRPALIERSALLAKCDLVTAMVYEFPALQGTMGRYYAERAGEEPCVCAAMEEQYRPRFAGDALASSPCGQALAIADRIDTLVGVFGIGLRPTGAKDPYGLRRASIAVLRLLIEGPLDLDLRLLLSSAREGYSDGVVKREVVEEVLTYMLERLAGYYADQGVSADTVDAVLQTGCSNPWDIDRRIAAVTTFRSLPAAESLAAANKRIRNILNKIEGAEATSASVDDGLLSEPSETVLAARVGALRSEIGPLVEARDYVAALTALATLGDDVDRFFTDVMVMADDAAVRNNRINILRSLAALFLEVADISKLQ